MNDGVESPFRVPFDGDFDLARAPTTPPEGVPTGKTAKKALAGVVDEIETLQRKLYADNRFALLLIFQAMDAAGKDGTIRAVFSGVNPAGFQVSSFKKPSPEELDHDFLWRTARRLPERGRIGVFNRSYYEEVLVVRVHPDLLEYQRLPEIPSDLDQLWRARYQAIRCHEKHLAESGTVVLKFFLHVSRDEQRERFLSRLDEPDKNWKFAASDIRERGFWDQYQVAYRDALEATSRPWAPWYAIPADSKKAMRVIVAGIVRDTLQAMPLRFPRVDSEEKARFAEMRALLENEG